MNYFPKNQIILSTVYPININGEYVKLKKGMSQGEIETILGIPFKIEQCANPLNLKLVYKINSGASSLSSYSILFTEGILIYVAKLK